MTAPASVRDGLLDLLEHLLLPAVGFLEVVHDNDVRTEPEQVRHRSLVVRERLIQRMTKMTVVRDGDLIVLSCGVHLGERTLEIGVRRLDGLVDDRLLVETLPLHGFLDVLGGKVFLAARRDDARLRTPEVQADRVSLARLGGQGRSHRQRHAEENQRNALHQVCPPPRTHRLE